MHLADHPETKQYECESRNDWEYQASHAEEKEKYPRRKDEKRSDSFSHRSRLPFMVFSFSAACPLSVWRGVVLFETSQTGQIHTPSLLPLRCVNVIIEPHDPHACVPKRCTTACRHVALTFDPIVRCSSTRS